MSLITDTNTFHYNKDTLSEGMIYCGFTYRLCFRKGVNTWKVWYIPPRANPKLGQLHKLFEDIIKNQGIAATTAFDTTRFDSIIYSELLNFSPPPPLKSIVKFTPPIIRQDK